VKANGPGDAVLAFEVKGGGDVDRVEMKRHVELPVSVESSVAYGEMTSDTAIALGDLRSIRRDQGGLTVKVASSALVGLGTTIDRLQDYPYACTEQLSSRVLPLVATLDLAKDSGAKLPADLNASIDGAIETILKRQGYDGGFGFWDKSTSEPWLSAYAMLAIGAASDRKRFVPHDVLERGRDYLTVNLSTAVRRIGKRDAANDDDDGANDGTLDAGAGDAGAAEAREKAETAKAIDYATATLLADTLATLGTTNPGTLNVLYDARAGQRLFAQATLLHAMAKSEMAPAQIKTLTKEIESRLRVGPNDADVDEPESDKLAPVLDSHARTLAMILRALLAADPKHALAPRLARRLLALRKDGGWRTTQEDTWALLALADYRKVEQASSAARSVRTLLGGTEILKSEFARGAMREDGITIASEVLATRGGPLTFELGGDGPVYYAAELKYATAALPARPRDEGLFVVKYVRGVAATEVASALPAIPKQSASAVNAGDLVIVDLLFESAEPREQIVLDDPLPAGLEALDYDLDTTSQAKRDAEAKRAAKDEKTPWLGTTFRAATPRREVKDDRVLHFFGKIEPGMYRVQYLARATSVGAFVVPPTRIEAMYAPEIYGQTAASTLAVVTKK
jgi:hypothetical protein